MEKFGKIITRLKANVKKDLKLQSQIIEDVDNTYEMGYLNALNQVDKNYKKLVAPNEDFNGMTPKDAMEEIDDFFSEWLNENEGYDDERLSDAIKRMRQLVEEL